MKLKILKRNWVFQQTFLFVLLSPFYLVALSSLSTGLSPLSPDLWGSFLKTKFLIIFLTIFTAGTIWNARAWSGRLLAFFIFLMGTVLAKIYLGYQDKIVLFLLFFYLLLGLGVVVVWVVELSRVVYHPGFNYRDLGIKSAYPIKVEFFVLPDEKERKYYGYLSNWDIANCFVVVDDEKFEFKKDSVVEIKINFLNYSFEGRGIVISSYLNGFGLAFLEDIASPNGPPRWREFYDIMSERGIVHQL